VHEIIIEIKQHIPQQRAGISPSRLKIEGRGLRQDSLQACLLLLRLLSPWRQGPGYPCTRQLGSRWHSAIGKGEANVLMVGQCQGAVRRACVLFVGAR
jgi:hypothetical protein